MQTIKIQPELGSVLSELATRLNISEYDVLRQAVYNYMEKVKKKDKIMSFAGILDDNEAEELLNTIRENRVNKNWDTKL